MNARQPVLFVSHGAPDVVRQPGATLELWKRLGALDWARTVLPAKVGAKAKG